MLVMMKGVCGGSIVNILLVVGFEVVKGYGVYFVMKWVVRGIIKIVALEWGCYGIWVNLVYLGVIETLMMVDIKVIADPIVWVKFECSISLGRVG